MQSTRVQSEGKHDTRFYPSLHALSTAGSWLSFLRVHHPLVPGLYDCVSSLSVGSDMHRHTFFGPSLRASVKNALHDVLQYALSASSQPCAGP